MAKVVKKKKRKLGGGGGFGGGGGASSTESPFRPYTVAKVPPCQDACPIHTDIRGVLTTIAQSEKLGRTFEESFEKAWGMIVEKNPFPAVIGRVCPHPCESKCNRNELDAEVGFNSVERFLGDYGLEHNLPLPKLTDEKKTQKVAVVGAGPAGLSCAYQLARRGYPVTVFEAFSHGGGMLRYGIPAYRLPREILEAEIRKIQDLGVEIKYNTSVGNDIPFDQIKKEFDAIFLGIGAHEGWTMGVPGEDVENVYTGTNFLNLINSGQTLDLGERLYVIGGGDTAIDAARVSLRLGVKEVVILYRRTRQEMPAIDQEIEEAIEEGVKIEYLAAPVEILSEDGKVSAIKALRMELGEPDSSGRRRPVPIEGSEYTQTCSTVVLAIGQQPQNFQGLESFQNERGKVIADDFGQTGESTVYAGGDLLKLGLVNIAIAEGSTAAQDIDRYLQGGERKKTGPAEPRIATDKMRLEHYPKLERTHEEHLPLGNRFQSLDIEVHLGLKPEQVIEESKRCMSCGYCFDCERCWMYCQASAVLKPAKKGDPYIYKHELCTGCKKCAEECPCGFLDMR
jgi:NADPH-dependent glutamate synthase beta subunit-like oxidoreductase